MTVTCIGMFEQKIAVSRSVLMFCARFKGGFFRLSATCSEAQVCLCHQPLLIVIGSPLDLCLGDADFQSQVVASS